MLAFMSGISELSPGCFLDLPCIISLESCLQNLRGLLNVSGQGTRLLAWLFLNLIMFASRLESCDQGYHSAVGSGHSHSNKPPRDVLDAGGVTPGTGAP